MTDENKVARASWDTRRDRLKSALRENLKRRKLQLRERDRMNGPADGDDAAPRGEIAPKTGG